MICNCGAKPTPPGLAQIKLVKKMAPSLDAKHYIDIDEPEECVLLLDSSLRSPSFWMFSPVYSYIEWLKTQDPHGAYRVYREHLQIFQAQTPHQRLTLKAPAHAGCVDALHAAVPEAMMIHTTRDPEPVRLRPRPQSGQPPASSLQSR